MTTSQTPGTPAAATPGTFVQLGASPSGSLSRTFGPRLHEPNTMAPELALVLAAVLLAAAEQVNDKKLAAFGVSDRAELTLLALAMAFRDDDTGLVGDVFEWSLLLALNNGEPGIVELMTDALRIHGENVEQPQGVLVAAEPGRLVAFSPQLPPRAALATGRRGRPPYVAGLLETATTRTWKADLLVGTGERWVSASLKSNPRDLERSLQLAASTPYPPRIGITASHTPGLTRDPQTGAVLVHVPVNGHAMGLSKLVLADVIEAFARDLNMPGTPLRQDVTGIGRQLHRWQDRTVADAATTLLQKAEWREPLFMWPEMTTGASVADASGALVAFNPLLEQQQWSGPDRALRYDAVARRRFAQFDPIDD